MKPAVFRPAPSSAGGSRKSVALAAGSVLTAGLASLCCVLPVVFGFTSATAAGAAALSGAWRPYLLGATFGLLGLGFYYAYRPSARACHADSSCAAPPGRRLARIVLWLAAAASLALAALPYFSGALAAMLWEPGPDAVQRSRTHVTGRASGKLVVRVEAAGKE